MVRRAIGENARWSLWTLERFSRLLETKTGNRLAVAAFFNFEIFLFEIGDRLAILVHCNYVEQHEMRAHAKSRGHGRRSRRLLLILRRLCMQDERSSQR